MDSTVVQIINKALDGGILNKSEIVKLLEVENLTPEAFALQQAGRAFTSQLCDGKAEVHSHIGLDAAPCPNDCKFCSFAASAGIFREHICTPIEAVLQDARDFDKAGVNAIYLVTTVHYGEERFLETAKAVMETLCRPIPVIANIPDFSADYAKELKSIGISGIYHTVRLGEGVFTRCKIEKRLATIQAAKDAGLALGNCIEPIGPEHKPDEIADLIVLARDLGVAFSGAMRRNTVPGTAFEKYGNISYSKLATIAGAIALGSGPSVKGNCTHEPSQLCAQAGCNIVWAERGTSPRDTDADTQRGFSVEQCRDLLREADWEVLEGPSRFY